MKVGQAENQLINEFKKFKEDYLTQLESIEYGIKVSKKFLEVDEDDESLKFPLEIISKLKCLLMELNVFSNDDGSWEFKCKLSQNNWIVLTSNPNKTNGLEDPINEKSIIYALMAFRLEICKLISEFKAIQRGVDKYFWPQFETDLEEIVLQYINYYVYN